jgi:CDP-diacylglycerol--glycerol-3-phosphate 3-phosphatidyltransferase
MRETAKTRGRRLLRPLVILLARAHVPPAAVTITALPLSAVAGWLFAIGRFVPAGVVLALVGLCDSLDGEVSRYAGKASAAGAFLDSNVDRLSEALVLVGIYWYYQFWNPWHALLAVLALVFSLLVSYVRARAEGLGRECAVGLFERPVRLVVLLVGALLLGRTYMPVATGIVAAGSLVTFLHRFGHVLRGKGPAG